MYFRNIISITLAAVVAAPVLLSKVTIAEAQKFISRDRLVQGLQVQSQGQQPRKKRRGSRNRNAHSDDQNLRQRRAGSRKRRAPRTDNRIATRRAPQNNVQELRAPRNKRVKRRAPRQENRVVLRRAPSSNGQKFRAPPPNKRVERRAPRQDGRVVLRRAPSGNNAVRSRPPQGSGTARIRVPQRANGHKEFRAPPPKKQFANPDRAPIHNSQTNPQFASVADQDGQRGIAIQPAGTSYPDRASVDLEILFEYNSDRIDPKSVRQLITLGEALQDEALKASQIMIAGHTDATGSNSYNDDLSYRRARSVYEFLTAYAGVDPNRLYVEGYGEELLKYPDAPSSGQNRRVEIINLGA